MKLNKAKINSVSTTSLCSDKESTKKSLSSNKNSSISNDNYHHFHDSNPTTMLIPNTTATAFRSFIKTKSTGIMVMRKDHSDDDDEEVEKLCDSECSKLSQECCTTPNTADDDDLDAIDNRINDNNGNDLIDKDPAEMHHQNNDQQQQQQQQPNATNNNYRKTNRSISSSDNSNDSFTIHSIDTNHSYISSDLYEQHHHHQHQQQQQQASHLFDNVSISSSTFITNSGCNNFNNNNNNTNNQQQQLQEQKQIQKAKRHNYNNNHLRSNPIIPILKSNRFIKHSSNKASNLLFNTHNRMQKNYHLKKRTSSECGEPNTNISSSTSSSSTLYSTSSQELFRSLRSDRMIITEPDEDRRRRTIIIEKQKNSFGFTLQTYGIKHGQEIELITYVDEVIYGGPAFRGGMRPGDVILSINGRDVEHADHQSLVNMISSCEKTMRLVVLFEDCVRKIELHIEFIKLQKSLQQKLTQLEILNQRENQILLNAALRNCRSIENTANTNKKYASKSLNVSLNDLDDYHYDIDDEYDDNDDDDDVLVNEDDQNNNNNKLRNYKTSTFPRNSGTISNKKNQEILMSTSTTNDSSNKDDNHNPIDENNDEDKRNGNDMLNDSVINIGQQQQQQSLSLSQSKNDCLTNEAYEDDENLAMFNHGNDNNENTKISISSINNHRKNLSNDSKDFVTKL